MCDPELFRTTRATGPINANNATEEAEEVMKSVVDACDAAMPRKSTCNRRPSVYWWNNNIAALRKECIKARRAKTHARKEELRSTKRKARDYVTGTSEIHQGKQETMLECSPSGGRWRCMG